MGPPSPLSAYIIRLFMFCTCYQRKERLTDSCNEDAVIAGGQDDGIESLGLLLLIPAFSLHYLNDKSTHIPVSDPGGRKWFDRN
jgi:hypothetical protein